MLAVRVCSRDVDKSEQKPFFFVIVGDDWITEALCEYVHKGLTVLVSTSGARNLGFVYPYESLTSCGDPEIQKKNVYSSFYTERINILPIWNP